MENPQQKDILKAFIKVGQTWTFGVEIDLKKKKKSIIRVVFIPLTAKETVPSQNCVERGAVARAENVLRCVCHSGIDNLSH